MGRITIFTTAHCHHCRRARAALDEQQLPYYEIDLTKHPHRKRDLLSLTDRLSVPQVFFNSHHIGGADATIAILNQWKAHNAADRQKRLGNRDEKSILQREIEAEMDPTDARLAVEIDQNSHDDMGVHMEPPRSPPPRPPPQGGGGGGRTFDHNVIYVQDAGIGGGNDKDHVDPSVSVHHYHYDPQQDDMDDYEEIAHESLGSAPHTETQSNPNEAGRRCSIREGTDLFQSSVTSELTSSFAADVNWEIPLTTASIGCVDDTIKLPGRKFVNDDGDPQRLSVLEVTRLMVLILPRKSLHHRAKLYHDCFRGSQGVDALCTYFQLHSPTEREEAVAFGRELQRRQILDHVTSHHSFGDTWYFYRLQPFKSPSVLNTFRIWTNPVSHDGDPVMTLHDLCQIMQEIHDEATSAKTGKMDYLAAAKMEKYWFFEEAVCELQAVKSLATMNEVTKLAFGLNLYNLMIRYALLKVGIPTGAPARWAFFHHVSFNVGGDVLSFSDLENGVLRANARPPFQLSTPFAKRIDTRWRLALPRVDPRIHFALHCGAQSCPPVQTYTAGPHLHEELQAAAIAFCEQDAHVQIHVDRAEIHLSPIFNWYRSDFLGASHWEAGEASSLSDSGRGGGGANSASSSAAAARAPLAAYVAEFLQGDRRRNLERLMRGRRRIRIKFLPYDWSTNASHYKPFNGNALQPDHAAPVRALLRYMASSPDTLRSSSSSSASSPS